MLAGPDSRYRSNSYARTGDCVRERLLFDHRPSPRGDRAAVYDPQKRTMQALHWIQFSRWCARCQHGNGLRGVQWVETQFYDYDSAAEHHGNRLDNFVAPVAKWLRLPYRIWVSREPRSSSLSSE